MERFTLEEFGLDFLSWPSLNESSVLMVFETFDDAAEMAEWMLEGGPEEGQLPIIGILAHDHDPNADVPRYLVDWQTDGDPGGPADPQSWSAGWVQWNDPPKTTSRHEGDYESEPTIWATATPTGGDTPMAELDARQEAARQAHLRREGRP